MSEREHRAEAGPVTGAAGSTTGRGTGTPDATTGGARPAGMTADGSGATDDGGTAGGGGAIRRGPGRALIAVYLIFAIAATCRAGVQIVTKFAEAPLAYVLSALAAVIYIVATVGLARGGGTGRRTALVCCAVELVGVLVVGTISLLDPALFPDDTVWSRFGEGYGYVPLVLPVLGLLWLRQTRPRPAR